MAPPTPRAIVSKVRTFVRRYDVLRSGPVVLAVSGGTDSTALALILAELADELGLVIHVAHFDHRTRPDNAAADAQFVSDLANRIGAPLRIGRADVPTRSEDDARQARYAFLRRAAEHAGATAIATGHTLDDQAETVLLHLVRGSGLAGAAAMRPLRDGIARPLLAVSRAETAAICRAAAIVPREDPTNTSLRFARNRVRLRVLPELAAINPKVREALARFADAAADARTSDGGEAGGSDTTANVEIDVTQLPAARFARERTLAEAYARATGAQLTQRQRLALADLASTTDGTRRIDLLRGGAVREYRRLRLQPTTAGASNGGGGHAAAAEKDAPVRETPLARGSSVEWHGWRLALGMEHDGLPFAGFVDATTARRIAVRGRRPGDRVSEHGKLQDLFVDAKIPARLRDHWPIVTVADVPMWVPGLTPPPRSGRIALAAGPVGDDLTDAGGVVSDSATFRQVASKSEARPQGGKRGRP